MKRIIVDEIGGIKIPDTVKRPMIADWFDVLAVSDDFDYPEVKPGSEVFGEGYANFAVVDNVEYFIANQHQIYAVRG